MLARSETARHEHRHGGALMRYRTPRKIGYASVTFAPRSVTRRQIGSKVLPIPPDVTDVLPIKNFIGNAKNTSKFKYLPCLLPMLPINSTLYCILELEAFPPLYVRWDNFRGNIGYIGYTCELQVQQ